MLLFRPSEDQDVVQVDHHDTFCYEVPKDVVHHSLEGDQAVSHAKEHYQGFEQASIGPEGCLPLVSGLNANVVETPTNIQLGEVPGSAELRYEFRDQWKRVLVRGLPYACLDHMVGTASASAPHDLSMSACICSLSSSSDLLR